jgi:hypothetical protein
MDLKNVSDNCLFDSNEFARFILTNSTFTRPYIQEFVAFKYGLTMTGNNWGSMVLLFFDNLSTLLVVIFVIQLCGDTFPHHILYYT